MSFGEACEIGHARRVAAKVVGLDVVRVDGVLAYPPGQVIVSVDDGVSAQDANRARHVRVGRGLLSEQRRGRGKDESGE
jgi:regulator of protease activity HflC (stomatin/prohibitin superfamily)